MKIIRTDRELQMPRLDRELIAMGHDLVLLPDGVSESDLADHVREADLLLVCYASITRRVIEAADQLRGIVKYGVGIDAIDIAAARERGILVVNIPDYAEETVAEGAFAHLIALARKLPALSYQMATEGWAWPEPKWQGRDIAESTVGIIGFGRIGRSIARMARDGFRARVIAFDPYVSADHFQHAEVERCDNLRELLPQSDFVTIHSVLNADTHHLLGENELSAMKSSAFLINVARGAIVDEAAMIRALDEGWIAGAGLDVFSQEPLALEAHPLSCLFGRPNVILTPHLTFYTQQAMERLETETLERCLELIEGRAVLIKSNDPRLRSQDTAVTFAD